MIDDWTVREGFCVLSALLSAALCVWEGLRRERAQERVATLQARVDYLERSAAMNREDAEEDEEEEPVLFVHGEIIDVFVTNLTKVRGRLVGVLPDGRFVVQVGLAQCMVNPDHCNKVEEQARGYRESSKGLN